jgi:membrane-associated phospholipid phosphatase
VTRHTYQGFTLAVIAVAVYALTWVGHRSHWNWVQAADSAVLRPLHDYGLRHPGWVRFWDVLCTVLGPSGFRAVGVAVVVIAVLLRNVRVVLFLVATIGLSGFVTQAAKALAHRPRPSGALVHTGFSSFPSGHALEVMAAVLALLAVSTGVFRRSVRLMTIVAGVLIVIAVGFGRVALNVHYPTDVAAGWALGYLWFFVWLLLIRPSPLSARAPPHPHLTAGAADEKREAPDIAR